MFGQWNKRTAALRNKMFLFHGIEPYVPSFSQNIASPGERGSVDIQKQAIPAVLPALNGAVRFALKNDVIQNGPIAWTLNLS